jgi:hypothetical protein
VCLAVSLVCPQLLPPPDLTEEGVEPNPGPPCRCGNKEEHKASIACYGPDFPEPSAFLPIDLSVVRKQQGYQPHGREAKLSRENFGKFFRWLLTCEEIPIWNPWLDADDLAGLAADPPEFRTDFPVLILDVPKNKKFPMNFNQGAIVVQGMFLTRITWWYFCCPVDLVAADAAGEPTGKPVPVEHMQKYMSEHELSHLTNNIGSLGRYNINPRAICMEDHDENMKRETCGHHYIELYNARVKMATDKNGIMHATAEFIHLQIEQELHNNVLACNGRHANEIKCVFYPYTSTRALDLVRRVEKKRIEIKEKKAAAAESETSDEDAATDAEEAEGEEAEGGEDADDEDSADMEDIDAAPGSYQCRDPHCDRAFKRSDERKAHERAEHDMHGGMWKCGWTCQYKSTDKRNVENHRKSNRANKK